MKKKLNSVLLFGILMTITITSNAQISMVKDLQTALNTAGSDPSLFVEMNGYLYFAATEPLVGNELWRTDGTPAGTELVKDIMPGTASSNPSNLFVYNGNLYFSAYGGGVYGNGLWKSDGTENGTKVVNIYNRDYVIDPVDFIIFQGSLFFQAADTNGTELFKSNGLDSGTVLVKDIFPDTAKKNVQNSSNPQNFIVVNGVLYFQAASKNKGTELWKSDGTSSGTVLVKDINADTLNSDPKELIDLNGTLYFVANNSTNGEELWKSDGSEAGTVMVKDIYPGAASSSINFMIKYNNKLYFSADNGTNGTELWTSDGTTTGTQLLININPGSASSYPSSFTEFNGKLYFTASNGSKGFELWVSDGTAAGTTLLKDIYVGSVGAEPTLYTVANSTLFFVAQNTGVGNELWKSDGTAAGTVMVKDILPGASSSNPRNLTAFKNMLIFNGEEGSNGREPWKSDGTATGTVIIKDILSGNKSANPSQLVNMKGILYFTAESTANGIELFKSNGTTAGTGVVRDIIPGISSSMPKNLTNVNDVLFFSADNSTNGNELWKSNGTLTGTVMVKDINPSFYASDPNNFCNVNGILYFSADDGVNGFELWKSDGTDPGTVMVKDIYPDLGLNGPNSSNPKGLVNVNGTLFFSATDSAHGTELWKSNGTAAGTVLVSDIRPGVKSPVIKNLFNYNGLLLFQGNDSINGIELWKSDGTATGTVMVKDIYPDTTKKGLPYSSNPQYFTELNGMVYFQATSKDFGTELWRTDGTDTGTKIFKDISPGSSYGYANSSNPQYLTKVGNEIFFSASFPTKGYELCKTDGTAAGTVLFKDIIPGYGGSNPNNLLADGTNLYFVADDGIHGSELWKAENNQCGKTQMVGETNPGKIGTGPTNLCMAGNVLYFTANTSAYGNELWKYTNAFTYSDTANFSFNICTGDSVRVNNKYYKTTKTYRDSLKTSKGCDSLILINLKVNLPYFNTTAITKCIGDSVYIQGKFRKVAGTYTDSLKTIHGCDSILDITLTLSPKPPTPVITIVPTITLRSSSATGNQWYDDNGPITGATGQTYVTTSSTKKFYVIVTINGCSSDPSNSANPQLGSISNDNLRNLNIYPNPVADNLIIEFKGNQSGIYTFYINNLEGQSVITGKLTEIKNEIDVSNIPKGIYFVKIIFENKIELMKIIRD